MATSQEPAVFLLRDKIRLFDRFAVNASAPNSSRSVRDDQLEHRAMFPGWKEVPKPPKQIPMILLPIAKADKTVWKPTAAKPGSFEIPRVVDDAEAAPSPLGDSVVRSIQIAMESVQSPRPNLRRTCLESIEGTIAKIMQEAITSNTHALTMKFQSVLKQQSNYIEQRHRALAERYKARVTKAMRVAEDRLHTSRTELAEARQTSNLLEKKLDEKGALQAINDELNEKLRALEQQIEHQQRKSAIKMKFLRALVAQSAMSSQYERKRPEQYNREQDEDHDDPISTLLPDSELAEEEDQPEQEETGNNHEQQHPNGEGGVDDECQHDKVDKLVLDLETKEEELVDLKETMHELSRKDSVLLAENARLKTELTKELISFQSERKQMATKVSQATGNVQDLTMKLHEARSSIEKLSERETKASASLAMLADKFKSFRSSREEVESDLRGQITKLRSDVRRARRTICVRSLLFQAHLKQMKRSMDICDSIDEYLSTQLTCKQCLNTMRKPQVLQPCGHSVCEACVDVPMPDTDTHRLVCSDCGTACDTTWVPNSVLDTIISQYNWWRVSLVDFRRKLGGAKATQTGANADQHEFAVAFSGAINETNPVMRQSLARLNEKFHNMPQP